MPIGTPTTMGNTGALAAGSPTTLSTTAAAPSGSIIIVFVQWYGAGITTTVTIPGLSVTQDLLGDGTADTARHCGVFSAQAPAGLASSTTITATHSASANNRMLCALYVTGIATSSPVDATGVGHGTGTAVTSSATTNVAGDLLFTGVAVDGAVTFTATGGATEVHDFQNSSAVTSIATEYEIAGAAGAETGTGTLSSTPAEWIAALVAYKADVAVGVVTSTFQAIPFMEGLNV